MARRLLLLLVAFGLPAAAGAQEAYRDARIRLVEPGVSSQRASESGADEALPNLPFLPGDRIWTDEGGRAEFQFADGKECQWVSDPVWNVDDPANAMDRKPGSNAFLLRVDIIRTGQFTVTASLDGIKAPQTLVLNSKNP